ncbi:diguanylate cyclase [Candidatus Izemoplasma sp. B36]|uniref:sensor domain-containing diguanylate cyclase n=1 Tax=Candidatus Izemoplasma sp. B36 TaxID=3242468 RepID=UPI0035589477
METQVKIRERNLMVTVNISSKFKPLISEEVRNKWQLLIDNVAYILDVPAALIMKITEENMEVFLRSKNEKNPYPDDGKDTLGHGLYCETVIGENRELLVDNSLKYNAWKDNPDVKLNMISYLGYPLHWEDGEAFGTICVLDSKTNEYSEKYKSFLKMMVSLIETDLKMLITQKELEHLSFTDILTEAKNRRYAMKHINELLNEKDSEFQIILMDLNHFKLVNDVYGHLEGDKTLKLFSKVVKNSIGKDCVFSRLGGDEFLLISKKPIEVIPMLMENINSNIYKNDFLRKINLSISYGVASSKKNKSINALLSEADRNLYAMKEKRKS